MHTFTLDKAVKPAPGWYRGDFHAHTHYSDGELSPHELLDLARNADLDFFAITDHNTSESFPAFGDPDDILIVPGIEVTLKQGHFNVFGPGEGSEGFDDLRGDSQKSQTPTERMAKTADHGLLNSINHPCLTPWQWRDNATDLHFVHCLEIWNDPSYPANATCNPQAVQLWTAWLNAGHRVTAIGGSDYHRPLPRPKEQKTPDQLGVPSTYVYATELSIPAILQGLREQRAYISVGPQVTFHAVINGRQYSIGEDLGELDGVTRFTATVSTSTGPVCGQILKNGQVIAEESGASSQLTLHYEEQTNSRTADWYRLDVLNPEGELLAITNPIFRGPKLAPVQHQYGDLLPDAESQGGTFSP